MPHCARPADEPLIHPAANAHSLRIGGLVPCSTVDWPGQLVAAVFLNGCPWRCTYCHNLAMQDPAGPVHADWQQLETLLEQRRGLLDGVVFSGGEPTSQASLHVALKRVRELGFATGLHTGGMYPARLARLLPLLDWVALDIKALPHKYDQLTRIPESGVRVQESLQLLLDDNTPFECRTTVDWNLLPPDDLLALAGDLATRGVTHYSVQIARPIDRLYQPGARPATAGDVLRNVAGMFQFFTVRDA